jgi:hypothetical protein
MSRLGFGLLAVLSQQNFGHKKKQLFLDGTSLIVITITRRSKAIQYPLTHGIVPNRGIPHVVGHPAGLLTCTQLSLMVPEAIINTWTSNTAPSWTSLSSINITAPRSLLKVS